MPTPILKVPVDDAAFQRFLETFKKYQDALADQPAMWAEAGDAANAVAIAGAAIAAEIAHQADETRQLGEEDKKRAAETKKAADEKKRIDKEQADRDKAAADRRRQAVQDVKDYAKGLADVSGEIGKWALLGGGAAIAGGALSFWGLDKFVESVGQERRLAQGYRVSTGQRQALDLNMSRFFDMNGALGKVATAQRDPGQQWIWSSLGISDWQNKDPAELLLEAASAAGRIHRENGGNVMADAARGLFNIFDTEGLNRLALDPTQLQTSSAQSRRDWAPGGAAFLSDKASAAWQKFTIEMERAGLTIKNKFVDKLSALENNGDLDKLVQKFTELSVDVLDKVDFKDLGESLVTFTKYLGGGQFKADFASFISDVGAVAGKMHDLLVAMGWVPAVAAPPDATPKPASGFGAAGMGIDDPMTRPGGYWTKNIFGSGSTWHPPERPLFGGYRAADAIGAYSGGRLNSQHVASLGASLMADLGLASAGAAGIISNLLHEGGLGGGVNERHPLKPGSRGGIGSAQWTGPRRREFEAWSAAHHMDPASDAADKAFLVFDMTTHYQALLERMRHESATAAAADFFSTYESGGAASLAKNLPSHIRDAGRVQHMIDITVNNSVGQNIGAQVLAASR